MSRFKFRAWDKKNERFASSYIRGLSFSLDTGQIYSGNMNVTDKFILMQSTGLKDNNGIEIFEGDVALMFIGISKERYLELNKDLNADKYIIEWMGSGWGFRPAFPKLVHPNDEQPCNFHRGKDEDEWSGNYFSVIGNIYENPELVTN